VTTQKIGWPNGQLFYFQQAPIQSTIDGADETRESREKWRPEPSCKCWNADHADNRLIPEPYSFQTPFIRVLIAK
jgi:hypothetical protein